MIALQVLRYHGLKQSYRRVRWRLPPCGSVVAVPGFPALPVCFADYGPFKQASKAIPWEDSEGERGRIGSLDVCGTSLD